MTSFMYRSIAILMVHSNLSYTHHIAMLMGYISFKCMVRVLKFQILFHTFLAKSLIFILLFLKNTYWNGKQCRPWSDCSFRSSLIWVCTVCICYFDRNLGIQNFRTFTIPITYVSQQFLAIQISSLVYFLVFFFFLLFHAAPNKWTSSSFITKEWGKIYIIQNSEKDYFGKRGLFKLVSHFY